MERRTFLGSVAAAAAWLFAGSNKAKAASRKEATGHWQITVEHMPASHVQPLFKVVECFQPDGQAGNIRDLKDGELARFRTKLGDAYVLPTGPVSYVVRVQHSRDTLGMLEIQLKNDTANYLNYRICEPLDAEEYLLYKQGEYVRGVKGAKHAIVRSDALGVDDEAREYKASQED